MFILDTAKEIIDFLENTKYPLITLVIAAIIYISREIFENFNLIAAIKALRGLKHKSLNKIIKNGNISEKTKELARQGLTAHYNYKLTGVFNYEVRGPVVEIVTDNNLPARYFKSARHLLKIENKKIVINEKLHKRDKLFHHWFLGGFCCIFWLVVTVVYSISFNWETALFSSIFYAVLFAAVLILTMPPLKSYIDKVRLYVDQYNLKITSTDD